MSTNIRINEYLFALTKPSEHAQIVHVTVSAQLLLFCFLTVVRIDDEEEEEQKGRFFWCGLLRLLKRMRFYLQLHMDTLVSAHTKQGFSCIKEVLIPPIEVLAKAKMLRSLLIGILFTQG